MSSSLVSRLRWLYSKVRAGYYSVPRHMRIPTVAMVVATATVMFISRMHMEGEAMGQAAVGIVVVLIGVSLLRDLRMLAARRRQRRATSAA